jgi:hypothetical protein
LHGLFPFFFKSLWEPLVLLVRPGNPSRWSRIAGPALVLLAAVVAVVPQLVHGPSCGHDFDFHLVSWFDCLNSWRHGILYPHWAPSANYGAGEPRFVFYPPLTWMLGAALGLILPWTLVPLALTFMLLAATGLATRALARQLLTDGAATLAGCTALFSGYALFTAYERTAFGELAGGCWIPLLLLFALSPSKRSPVCGEPELEECNVSHPFRTEDQNAGSSTSLRFAQKDGAPALRELKLLGSIWRRALDGSAAPLALAVAGCWLSNLPLGVMACYLLAAVAVAAALLARSWAPMLRAALAATLGLGLTAVYLLPTIVEQRWVNIRQAIDDPGDWIENSWLFARHADPTLAEHDTVLLKVSIIAASMIAVALLGLLVYWLRDKFLIRHEKIAPQQNCHTKRSVPGSPATGLRRWGGRAESKDLRLLSRWWIPLALIPLAVLLLQLPLSLPVWNLLPKLRFLQFPWRWLLVLEAPMAIFFAAALWPTRRWLRVAVAALCAAFFMAATAFVAKDFYQACDDEDAVAPMLSAYRSGAGFAGASEYAPPGTDNELLPPGLPAACLVTDPVTILGWSPGGQLEAPLVWKEDQRSCIAILSWQSDQPEHKRLRALVPRAGFLILRLRGYPAWRIVVNGRPIASLPHRDDGLIAVPIPQGPVDLAVDWTTTPDVIAGRWLSALAVLLLTALWLLERKLKKSCQPRLS